jgi:hypothetical protein
MHTNILSTIGNTPLIRLSRVLTDINFQLLAKLDLSLPNNSVLTETIDLAARPPVDSEAHDRHTPFTVFLALRQSKISRCFAGRDISPASPTPRSPEIES